MIALGTIAGVLVLMFFYMCVIRPFFMKKSVGLDLCYHRKRHTVSNESSMITREIIPQNNRRGVSRIEGMNVS